MPPPPSQPTAFCVCITEYAWFIGYVKTTGTQSMAGWWDAAGY